MTRKITLALLSPVAALVLGVVGCAPSTTAAPGPVVSEPTSEPSPTAETVAAPTGAQPRLAADPVQIADDLVADEQALRDPATGEPALTAAAHRQQAAYRAIGRNPEWDSAVRPRIPAWLGPVYDRNIDARRQLTALAEVRDTLPAWRIAPPPPVAELMGYYREAEAASGVPWNYLAAINMIETRFGSISGTSNAGAQGPMQFMPATWAAYGKGDVRAPRDAILAAGRYLAASGFAANPDRAIFAYNNADQYVRAVTDYAAVMAAEPATLGHYHRWQVYYTTTLGDVLLPVGYESAARIPVAQYLADHPQ